MKFVKVLFRFALKIGILAFCVFGFYLQFRTVTSVYRSYPYEVVLRDMREKELKFPSISICTDMWISLDSDPCLKEPSLCSYAGQDLTLGIFRLQFNPWSAAAMSHEPHEIFNCTMKSLSPECKSFDCINHLRKSLFWPSNKFCFTVDNYMYADALHSFRHCSQPWMYELNIEHFWGNRTVVLMNTKNIPIFFQEPYTTNAPYAAPVYLEPGKKISVNMQQTVTTRLKAPYASKCRDYFEEGITTRFYGKKLRQACVQDCTMSKEIEICGCYLDLHQYTFPEAPGTPCNLVQGFTCFDKVGDTAYESCVASCPPACSETEYDVRTYGLKDILLENGTVNLNRLSLTVRFRTDKVFFSTEQPSMNFLEVTAYVGGFLGFWLGFSLYHALTDGHDAVEKALKTIHSVFQRLLLRESPTYRTMFSI